MPSCKREQTPFTGDEVKSIIDYAYQYLTQSIPHVMHRIGKMIVILLRTGMRREELLALTWGCLDFEKDIILIRQAVTIKGGEPILKEPKTFHSRRDIPMHPEVKKLLSEMERGADDDFVFPTESGGLMHPRNFNRDYAKFFEASGIKYHSPHSCRHTFACQLHEKGVDLKTISELLGHSRIEVTNIYTHTNEKSKVEAISRL